MTNMIGWAGTGSDTQNTDMVITIDTKQENKQLHITLLLILAPASRALFYYTLCTSALQTMMQETTQFYLSRQETLTLTLCILLTLNLKVTLQNTAQPSLLFSHNILSLW